MVPRTVLTRSSQISLNIARPVNTVQPRTTVNNAGPIKNVINNAYSTARRPFNKITTANNSNFTKKVNTVKRTRVNTARPKAVLSAVKGNKGNAIKASACWIWRPNHKVLDHGNPQQDLKDKGVIDSGCSRHMIGNKSYLTDYEEIDGGFVAFGGNSKGGKIIKKGKIRTGKLDFEDVYFVKELKFNLFSVSQMCDTKYSVLFTDTECVVLSPDFKLNNESHVLLKVPRKDNMYSVDLKNVVPQGGLTCLFAKAILDEYNLWHRRLGHVNFKTMNKLGKQHIASYKTKTVSSISQPLQMLHIDLFGPTFVKSLMEKMYCLVVTDDFSRFSWVFFLATKGETSEILKTFITGIENLIDLRVKVIRCDNGTEFKNRVMNQFCEMKGIKREFSVARTPQQNGVAERKNRTLIEAARTMLADSKLPTTFWAEAVNTACYVQNRVLVIKPHNKTPYELFLGRKPALSFMRPFGCPVTILNTIDHLGKFDGKADEGFFVGYSTNSKAFRVFNSRTRIVKENLHVQFSENTSNIAGSGPNWLFDIDALTKSMNYKPVVAGNQSNSSADLPFSSSSKDSPDAGFKPSGEEEKKDAKDPGNESGNPTEGKDSEVPSTKEPRINQEKDASVNSTNNINTVSSTVNAASIEDNAVDENIVYGCAHDPNILDLEEIGRFSDAEDDGAEADMTNLDTHIPVSPIPTTRIHKDHLIEQIFGDLNSAPQTRRMTKNLEEHGKIEEEVYVYQPPGFEDPDFPDRVYKVEKALYGLQQAPKAWYETLSTYLLDNGFQRGKIDKTLFIKREKGLQVKQKEDKIFISQDKYVIKILKKFSFSDVKTANIPMETHKPLHKDADGEDVDEHLYRSMIRSLMYLTSSRPNIMFATVVANSTTEAEYIATSNCCGQVLWIQNQMLDYGYNFMHTKIYIDNESTICIVKNPIFYSKTKHIEIRHHFIRDSNKKKLIQMIKIHTDQNVVDLLTKALDIIHKGWLEWNAKAAKDGIGVKTGNSRVNAVGHYLVLLGKKNANFAEIVDFLNANPIRDCNTIFSSMLAQQADIGEGSGQPTDPQHTSTSAQPSNEEPISIPSSSQPKKTHRPRKAKRATEISQSSGPISLVTNKTVTKEKEDRMEKDATTASSLKVEPDSGNINRTQSMATLNEPSPQGTGSGSGLRCQDTILGDAEAQTRLKLKKLMDLYTKLSDRVLDLETTKTAQAKEIASLKKRDKKLERKRKSKTPGMNLFKIDMDEVFKDVEGDAEQVISAAADEVPTSDAVNTAGNEVNTTSALVTPASVSVSTVEPITTGSVNITTANVEVSTASPIAATITTVELTLAGRVEECKTQDKRGCYARDK
ncbi:putative ribonuclease H-like domain-containing protein [Tanacetum coccineum]|uniref:Ribonuclease H-like domain-containing protein n=1 Tax=Tanacetum coccineum TaxID=301880 RepID=A0ABQ4YL03_9ASTR